MHSLPKPEPRVERISTSGLTFFTYLPHVYRESVLSHIEKAERKFEDDYKECGSPGKFGPLIKDLMISVVGEYVRAACHAYSVKWWTFDQARLDREAFVKDLYARVRAKQSCCPDDFQEELPSDLRAEIEKSPEWRRLEECLVASTSIGSSVSQVAAPESGQASDRNPIVWVDEWTLPGLTQADKNSVKARLLLAHADSWETFSADTSNPDGTAMMVRRSMDAIAEALFAVGRLSSEMLESDVLEMVCDVIVASRWWSGAVVEQPYVRDLQFGHYWVRRDTPKFLRLMAQAQICRWLAKLISEPDLSKTDDEKLLPDPGWNAVEIIFISDERVQIHNGPNIKSFNYSELDLADGRNGKPKQAWLMLRELAKAGGTISTAIPKMCWTKVERRMQEVREVLRKHFGTDEDPIPFVASVGYKAKFKIRTSHSLES